VTVASADDTRLAAASDKTPAHTPGGSGWLSSSGSIDHGRFAPGAVLAGRYCIIGLVGRGGMGEVYRADDLRLGQQVALKLLPAGLSDDPVRLAQFHNEVRTARQVSHPNVCRMYDIGEIEGALFLTMEYVDGEDLTSLLRRIGRLPEDKALDIARQIAAGLAAAHERGVVHRDLKPANIMLDGAGKVRLMDFGLAAVGAVTDVRPGTPAYMAPEQLAGREVTARSDIYALGLVLYELFTGRRAFDAKTLNDLVEQHEAGVVVAPRAIIAGLDPAIARAILRCLEQDPARRPALALAVSAALPGGDPLAAALAANAAPFRRSAHLDG
jgi:serine/threonine protein kinase